MNVFKSGFPRLIFIWQTKQQNNAEGDKSQGKYAGDDMRY
jgi:hypothetical protein